MWDGDRGGNRIDRVVSSEIKKLNKPGQKKKETKAKKETTIFFYI